MIWREKLAKNDQMNKDSATESRHCGNEIILVYLWQYDSILTRISEMHDMSVREV